MISIHQSQFIPWLPYFYKILSSDIFVQLDDVQFQKNGLQNRNQIKTPQGAQWVTLPIKQKLGTPINEVQLSNRHKDIEKAIKTITLNYQKSLFYAEINEIWEVIRNYEGNYLFPINDLSMREILKKIQYKGEIVLSSSLNTQKKKDDLVIEIIKLVGEKEYISGKGALQYMDLEKFKKNEINIYVVDFQYSEYPQLWLNNNGFIPNLSVIDLLYNNLSNSRDYILSNGSLTKII